MRKVQVQQAVEFVKLLEQAHNEIKKSIENNDIPAAQSLLTDCQEGAIQLGNLIEKTEGEGFITVNIIENYCELIFQLHQSLGQGEDIQAKKAYKNLRQLLIKVENSIKNDIPVRREAVFLPYKASMWDSLESIWKAANEDELCDAYVIPIPYYDKNRDGSFKEEHYEGYLFPDYVPITKYDSYDFAGRRPDMIFIHNPYDNYNFVTSVHPFFYSKNLKNFTDILVYVPYYSTSGGMSEAQSVCSAYYNVDYIVIQAEKYRSFFDPDLPKEKLLPLGSPKFDRVINICNNPPEPPADWKEKMAGKKVYFYNTSINGMLANTEKFLRKMEYVFRCFVGRDDACLLWRPHPLLESTFDSMRAEYKPVYNKLKEYFITNNLGIYDETPDITNTIALCDAYIGDAGTSVTSLFGIVGKPLFILNNNLNIAPGDDDWRGSIIKGFHRFGNDAWMVTQGNKLYHSPNNDYKYEYCCDLSEYAGGNYYLFSIFSINDKNYVFPANACDILIVGKSGIEKKIKLDAQIKEAGAFYGVVKCEKYLFLLPNKYPAIVRYNTENGKIDYFNDNLDFLKVKVNGEDQFVGAVNRKGYLYFASPVDNRVLIIEAATGNAKIVVLKSKFNQGYLGIRVCKDELWLLPYSGRTITCWNPDTGEIHEYDNCPKNLKCKHTVRGYELNERPFADIVIFGNYAYLTPFFGNMFIRLDIDSGEMTEWIPPFPVLKEAKNVYYDLWSIGYFIRPVDDDEKKWLYFSRYDAKLYEVDFEKNDYSEIEIEYNIEHLRENENGFREWSEWFQYGCFENAFNSLTDFLDDSITGNRFDKGRQLKAYGKIAANYDGTSGKKIYEFMCRKL